MRIAVDAMGGDHAPREVVRGAIDYAAGTTADEVILVGDVARIEGASRRRPSRPANLRLVDAPEVIGMGDRSHSPPDEAPRLDRRRHRPRPRRRSRTVVSAGSTGATMAAAIFRLGRIGGIDRPALPAHMVTDTGPVMLSTSARTWTPSRTTSFSSPRWARSSPSTFLASPTRIGLLNVGEEVEKGDERARETYAKPAEADLNFVGNVEAHDMIAHRADVVVCVGFVGNVVIKFFEGITTYIFRSLRVDLQRGPIAPLALLALKPGFDRPGALRPRALWRRAFARGEGVSIVGARRPG